VCRNPLSISAVKFYQSSSQSDTGQTSAYSAIKKQLHHGPVKISLSLSDSQEARKVTDENTSEDLSPLLMLTE